MPHRFPTGRTAASLAIAGLTALALAGCKPAAQPTAPANPAASAPAAKPGFAVSEARLVLPAVGGNPAAAYFTLDNAGTGSASLAAVSIAGAQRAEMHQTSGGEMKPVDRVDVSGGTHIRFAPGGLHVMVFGLPAAAKAGTTVDMTLTFSDGDKLTAPAKVVAPGSDDAMADMPGMDHR